MLEFFDLAWIDMTWQSCMAMNMCQHPQSHFLITGCVLWEDCEILTIIPLRSIWEHVFRCMKRHLIWDSESGDDTFTAVIWEAISMQSIFYRDKNAPFHKEMWKILLRAFSQYPERWCVLLLPLRWTVTAWVCVEMISRTWRTIFDQKRGLTMKRFQSVLVCELNHADIRRHETYFLMGRFSFQTNV
jgi:hypothetical protein